jgi:hypothetical protein
VFIPDKLASVSNNIVCFFQVNFKQYNLYCTLESIRLVDQIYFFFVQWCSFAADAPSSRNRSSVHPNTKQESSEEHRGSPKSIWPKLTFSTAWNIPHQDLKTDWEKGAPIEPSFRRPANRRPVRGVTSEPGGPMGSKESLLSLFNGKDLIIYASKI